MENFIFCLVPDDKISVVDIKNRLQINTMGEYLKNITLSWFGHLVSVLVNFE